jgi:signal transduction histidine kinase
MIAQSFGADIFMLYQADPNNGHLRLEACAGVTDEQRHRLETLRYGLAICAKSAEALQPIIATHIQDREAPNRRFVRRLGFRSYLYYPLVLNNRLHGTIAFASRLRDDYDPMDLDFFQTIAGTLAQALERRRLEAELQRHAANLDRLVRERTAKLEEAMAELEHMSYSMVHDMRAPLRAMETFATLAEEVCAGCARPEGLDYFHRIRESTRRLDRLVTDALNYNRVLREELPTAPVQLKRLLQSIIDTYPDLSSTVAEIHLDFEERCILGNESLLTQCFGNLLGNAVKFVAPGVRPRVRVWGACPPNEPSKVLVWVEDNGIGIPKEAQGRIFQMFQRMHRESEYPGTGIGLTIAKKAVERMGGRIGLKSEPGQGTRFWVELPLASS